MNISKNYNAKDMVKISFGGIGLRPTSNLKRSNEIYKTRSLQTCTERRDTPETERTGTHAHTHLYKRWFENNDAKI